MMNRICLILVEQFSQRISNKNTEFADACVTIANLPFFSQPSIPIFVGVSSYWAFPWRRHQARSKWCSVGGCKSGSDRYPPGPGPHNFLYPKCHLETFQETFSSFSYLLQNTKPDKNERKCSCFLATFQCCRRFQYRQRAPKCTQELFGSKQKSFNFANAANLNIHDLRNNCKFPYMLEMHVGRQEPSVLSETFKELLYDCSSTSFREKYLREGRTPQEEGRTPQEEVFRRRSNTCPTSLSESRAPKNGISFQEVLL